MTYNPITDLPGVNAEAFEIKVGSSTQVLSGEATHTAANFVAAIQDNDRVLILAETHALVQNEDITESGVVIQMEDRTALLALSSFTFTISGDENQVKLKLDGVGLNAFIVSGDYNELTLWFANGNADPLSDTGTDNTINFHVI